MIFFPEHPETALEQQNRSVLSVSEPFLSNPDLFDRQDEELLMNSLARAMDSADRSVAQVLLSSLESMGLADQLIDIELPVKPMRKPDWNRLSEMGDVVFGVILVKSEKAGRTQRADGRRVKRQAEGRREK